jgi:hypothetical protein
VPGPADKTARLRVVIEEDTRGAAKAAKALEGTRKESDKLDDSLKGTGKQAERTETQIKDLGAETGKTGKKLTDTSRDSRTLANEIQRLQAHMRDLEVQFARTGDASLLKGIGKDRSAISQLKRIKNELEDIAHLGGKSGLSGLGDIFSAVPGPLKAGVIAGLVEAAVVAAPAMGAVLAGAVAGAGGTLGVAGGILAAAQSPDVKRAFGDLGRDIKAEFAGAGDALVPEVIKAISIVRGDFASLNLGAAFEKAAPSIEIVAEGIGSLAKNFMPGFTKMLERATPYAEIFAAGMGDLGTALGGFLDDASRSRGAQAGLQGLFDFLAATVTTTGKILEWFSDRYIEMVQFIADASKQLGSAAAVFGQSELAEFFDNINKSAQGFLDRLPAATAATGDFASGMGDAQRRTQGLADALKNANKAYDDFFQKNMDLDQARLRVQQGQLELAKTLEENRGQWSTTTEEGLRNREALLRQVQALKDLRDAAIASGDGSEASVRKANAAYDRAIGKLEDLAKQAGIDKQTLGDLAGDYTVTFHLEQEAGKAVMAWSELRNAERKGQQNQTKSGKYQGHAGGGSTSTTEPFWVGEQGPELMASSRSMFVMPHQRSEAYAGAVAGSGGAPAAVTARVVASADDVSQFLAGLIRRFVRFEFGGNVQAAFGS